MVLSMAIEAQPQEMASHAAGRQTTARFRSNFALSGEAQPPSMSPGSNSAAIHSYWTALSDDVAMSR
jgi:hypothetical protein